MLPVSSEKSERLQTTASSQWEQLERKERSLWRLSLTLLLVLAAGMAANSWGPLRSFPTRLEALPVGLVVLVLLFGLYVWKKNQEIAGLRGFLRGLQESAGAPPTEQQFEKLLETIAQSQHGYRELIDSLEHVAFTISLRGEIQVANRRFVEILGVPFAQVIHHSLEEFICEPTRENAERSLDRFLERRSWTGIFRVRLRKTGEERFFDCMLHAIVSDGRVIGIGGLARDITAQRETESRFTQLFETLQEGVYFSTPEGALLEVNPAMARMLGFDSREELLSVNVHDLFFDPRERAVLLEEVNRLGSVHDREIRLCRKDGKPIRCLDSSTAIRDAAGKVVRYQGTLVDITERVEMERRLHQEQEFVRRLVASFPDAIVVLDTQGRYTFVSSRIQELLGYLPEELVGRPAGERTDPQDRPALLGLFRDLISGKTNFGQVEYRTQHKDGRWRTFRANASPLYDEENQIVGVVASARDVTQSKVLEQQLLQAEKLAAMGQMLAGVAHELNNPLTAILGVADLLRERVNDDSARRQAELVHEQARRAAHIIQSLLSFSRPSAPGRTRVQLGELFQRAVQLQEESLRRRRIVVELHREGEIPPVEGDPNQLLQIFLNLIINAEQAISAIRDHGTIWFRMSSEEGKAVVTVQDDGPGVAADVVGRIFDPFFTTKRPGGGTGLGLTISLAIAKEHGGTIEVDSPPGKGATFRVSLPAAGQPRSPGTSASKPAVALRGRTVLVVDDEEGIRELVQEGLSARGVSVDCAATVAEAISRWAGRSYDAVLCDFYLPDGSGRELFDQVLVQTRDSPPHFVFMTGELLEPDVVASFPEKGVRVLQKPFQISELAALLSDLFEPSATKVH